MRRAVARGRMVPQSRSTDPRMGRVSLKAATLYDRMWINADDQGRLSGDPDEIKYTVCPNLPDISKEDIPALLEELAPALIKVYTTSKTEAIQMLDWWEEQRLQWAYPSSYPPPPGWTDHLRFHPTPKEIVTENWPPTELPSKLPSALPNQPASALPNQPASALPSKQGVSPLTTPSEKEKEEGEEEEEEEGRLPSALGSRPSPSPADLTIEISEILDKLTSCFRSRWGRVPADRPYEVIPREPTARESAQLRDLAKELSAGGGCPLNYVKQVFDEAAEHEKKHISYVRKILLAWLGRERAPPA